LEPFKTKITPKDAASRAWMNQDLFIEEKDWDPKNS
jgi:hypothetical protein